MENEKKSLELIIIGAGPSGLGASIYASRYKLNHLVIGSEIGGQVTEAWEIENYAGVEKTTGKDLMAKFRSQSESLGGHIIQGNVTEIIKNEDIFEVKIESGEKYQAKTLILALGMKARTMNVPGEKELVGKGVSYCATCDAMFFRGKDVVVIGGGDSAATAAIHLSDFATHVTLLYRDKYTFEPAWEEQIKNNPKIDLVGCTKISKINGQEKVEGLTYETAEGPKELLVQGVFVEVGTMPGVVLAKNLGVATDEQDYIIVDQTQATNVEGVYAAGDVTTGSNKFRQIITAVAEGAVAAGSIYRNLRINKK